MTISLLIDTAGGSNFENNHLRNLASLHVGGSALATETLDVTGTVGISSTLKVDTVAEFGAGIGITLDGVLLKGTIATVNALLAKTDNSGALGASGTAFSDLFLASGAVINFNAADITITHSANKLTVAGGTWATAALTTSTIVASGIIKTDDVTQATSTTAASLQTDGGIASVKSAYIGGSLFLPTSGSVINWNAGDITLTHSSAKLTFGGDGAVEIDFANHEMTNVDINSGAIDGTVIGGASAAAGTFAAIIGTTGVFSGVLKTDDATDATSTTAASLQTDGGIACVKDVWIGAQLNVAGIGPHVIGGATVGWARLLVTGSFTSDASSNVAIGTRFTGEITGGSGDTNYLTGTQLFNTIVTQTASQNIGVISQLRINEPGITDNLTGDITVAATVHIVNAPTEGESNYALWVDSGNVQIDDDLIVSGTLTAGTIAADDNVTRIGSVTTDVGTGAASVITTLHTVAVAANAMGTNGGIRIRATGSVTGTNDTKTITITFGGDIIGTIVFSAGETGRWGFDYYIFNRAATGSQVTGGIEWEVDTIASLDGTASVDTTSAQNVLVRGTTDNASDEITASLTVVELIAD